MRCIILTAAIGLAGLAVVFAHARATNDEKAIQAELDSYVAAFNKGDLNGLLDHFAADADYINDSGKQYQGKAALAELFKRALADLKGSKLKAAITSFHFLRPEVAVADGSTELTAPDGTTDNGRFTAIWTKTGDKWVLSSIRDLPESAAADSAVQQLQQLKWLVGDWTHQSPDFSVQISGRWTLNKSFLMVEYTVKGKDPEDLVVVQYFGWNPTDEVIRSWFFDSKGGFGGGDWTREGNVWTANWSGVLSEGRTASSVSSLKFIDNNSFLFRSVDREVDGVPVDDVEVKFVRKTAGK